MIIKNNPDFADEIKYKDDAWRGFSAKEIVVFILAFAIAICSVYLLWKYFAIPITIAPYISVPLAVPIVLLGLYRYQGMNCYQFIRAIISCRREKFLYWDTGVKTGYREFRMKKVRKGKRR